MNDELNDFNGLISSPVDKDNSMESTGFPRGKSLTFMVDFQYCVVAHMYRSIDRFDASVYICILYMDVS